MANQVTATIEQRDLLEIDKVIYQAPQEELVARQVFNLKTDVDPGAEAYGYNVMTRSGAAKIIANGADDLPLVDSDLERFQQPIFSVADGIRYSVQELRQAQRMGQSVDSTKAETARRAIAEKENSMVFVGDAKHKLKGVVNADGIQVINAAKKFAEMTSAEIVDEIRKARSKIVIIPGMRTARLKLMLASPAYEELERRYSDYDSRSIKAVIQGNGWFESIVPVYDLDGAGATGSDCMIIMDTAPITCQILLPMEITRHPEEWKFPNWTVPFEERCGGALIRRPYGIVRVDGI